MGNDRNEARKSERANALGAVRVLPTVMPMTISTSRRAFSFAAVMPKPQDYQIGGHMAVKNPLTRMTRCPKAWNPHAWNSAETAL